MMSRPAICLQISLSIVNCQLSIAFCQLSIYEVPYSYKEVLVIHPLKENPVNRYVEYPYAYCRQTRP